MLRFREFLLLEYNEDKNWTNHGAKITERLKSQGIRTGHREFWDKQIRDHDPTPNKEYASWISQKYASGGIRHHEDIGSRVGPSLEIYHKHKLKKTLEAHGVPKDIGAIKNITHLEDSVDKLPSLHKNDNQKVNDSEVTKHDEEHWKVYTPHTAEASKKYGAGTKWCTAAKNYNRFKSYNDKGPMHIYVPKKPKYPGEKYQGHRGSFSFMNEKDEPVNSDEVFRGRASPHDERHGVSEEYITKIMSSPDHVHERFKALDHPKVTPEHITKVLSLSGKNNEGLRTKAMRHDKVTREHISTGLNDESYTVREAAIQHHIATPEHITKALSLKGNENEWIRRLAVQHPNVTTKHITKALSLKDDVGVRIDAMRSSKATREHISTGLADKNEWVRTHAVAHRNASPDQILKGLEDESYTVHKAARENPNLTPELLKKHKDDTLKKVLLLHKKES